MDSNQGKIDRAFQNKPKLFRVNQGQINNPYTNNPMVGYPPQNQMYFQQAFMPYHPQIPMHDPYYQAQFECNNEMGFQPQLTIPLNQIQEENEQGYNNQENQNYQAQDQELSQQMQQTIKMSFNYKNIPAPPPPPPEMIRALAQLIEANENQQVFLQQQTQQMPIPQFPTLIPQSMVKSNKKIQLTRHIYKNQNTPDEPINPKFIKPNK
ncbi:hypothetical protein ABPG72_009210 [Tetrahymena utriculariae]